MTPLIFVLCLYKINSLVNVAAEWEISLWMMSNHTVTALKHLSGNIFISEELNTVAFGELYRRNFAAERGRDRNTCHMLTCPITPGRPFVRCKLFPAIRQVRCARGTRAVQIRRPSAITIPLKKRARRPLTRRYVNVASICPEECELLYHTLAPRFFPPHSHRGQKSPTFGNVSLWLWRGVLIDRGDIIADAETDILKYK